MQKAQKEKQRADKSRAEAEKLIDHTLFDLRDKLEPIGKLEILKSTEEAVAEYYKNLGKEGDSLEILRRKSVSYNHRGDTYQAQGKLDEALTEYQKAYTIAERLAKADPTNSGWQRDLWVSYYKMYTLNSDITYLKKCVAKMQEMKQKGTLLPTDEEFLGIVKSEFKSKVSLGYNCQYIPNLDSKFIIYIFLIY